MKKLKVKLFEIKHKTDASEINTWLKANLNVEIVATNTFSNDHGWGYIVLYEVKTERTDNEE
jgi:hypothetical protein